MLRADLAPLSHLHQNLDHEKSLSIWMPGRGDGWGSSLWDAVQEEGGGRRVWGWRNLDHEGSLGRWQHSSFYSEHRRDHRGPCTEEWRDLSEEAGGALRTWPHWLTRGMAVAWARVVTTATRAAPRAGVSLTPLYSFNVVFKVDRLDLWISIKECFELAHRSTISSHRGFFSHFIAKVFDDYWLLKHLISFFNSF